MSDSIPSPIPWLVDPELVLGLRRTHAEQAFQAGEFERCLVETEELLAESPEDVQALWISARACLAMGDACTAEAALDQILDFDDTDRPAPTAHIHAELAFARFLQADFPNARASASSALALDRDLAAAWVCLGMAEERLDHPDEMERAYQRAEALQPGSAPRRLPSPPQSTWERLFSTAAQHLSEDESAVVQNLEVHWQDLPAATLLRSVDPPISPFIEALISGDDPSEELPDPNAPSPDSELGHLDAALKQAIPTPKLLTIYTANLLRGQPSTADLVDRMARALRSELAAWLGISAHELMDDGD